MEYTCVVCPVSCKVDVQEVNGEYVCSGNGCVRGKNFAINEHTCPKRMITSTVKVEGGILNRIPVVGSDEIPKTSLSACLEEIYKITLKAPVADGQVVIENVVGTGVSIITSRSMKAAK